MAKSYMFEHRKNILNEKVTNRTKLEPGDIVKFRYRGEDVHTEVPTVLILNPDWQGKIHGLTINYISENTLNKLYDIVKQTVSARIQKLIKLNLPLLKSDIAQPYKFYYNRLKPFIKENFRKGESPYRLFNLTGVTNIKKIDYRFRKMQKNNFRSF